MWVKRSTLEDMIPHSDFGTSGWKDDLNYLDSLSAASYKDDRIKEYAQTHKIEGEGSGYVFMNAGNVLGRMKELGLPIPTYRIQNRISQLEQVVVALEKLLKKHKGLI